METTTLKIKPADKKLLAFYKLENDLGTFSEAVRHLIARVAAQEAQQ